MPVGSPRTVKVTSVSDDPVRQLLGVERFSPEKVLERKPSNLNQPLRKGFGQPTPIRPSPVLHGSSLAEVRSTMPQADDVSSPTGQKNGKAKPKGPTKEHEAEDGEASRSFSRKAKGGVEIQRGTGKTPGDATKKTRGLREGPSAPVQEEPRKRQRRTQFARGLVREPKTARSGALKWESKELLHGNLHGWSRVGSSAGFNLVGAKTGAGYNPPAIATAPAFLREGQPRRAPPFLV